jgi:hypothetical protein
MPRLSTRSRSQKTTPSEWYFCYAGVGITPKPAKCARLPARHLCRRNKRGTHISLTLPPDHNFPRRHKGALVVLCRTFARAAHQSDFCSPLLDQLQALGDTICQRHNELKHLLPSRLKPFPNTLVCFFIGMSFVFRSGLVSETRALNECTVLVSVGCESCRCELE